MSNFDRAVPQEPDDAFGLPHQIEALEHSVDHMGEFLVSLRERLSPILRDVPTEMPVRFEGKSDPRAASSSVFGNRVRTIADRLESLLLDVVARSAIASGAMNHG